MVHLYVSIKISISACETVNGLHPMASARTFFARSMAVSREGALFLKNLSIA
jgi:hypothetical protein